MNLLQKSLLFLLFVLSVQVAMFGFLGLQLINSEKQSDQLTYSHSIISGRDRVAHDFYEAVHAAILMAVTGNKSLGRRLDQIASELPLTLKDMESQQYATPQDKRDLERISKITMYLIDELRSLRDSIMDAPSPDRFRQATRFFHVHINPHIDDLNAAMDVLAERHKHIERSSVTLQQFRNLVHTMIAAGIIGSITATGVIVFVFTRGVVNRLRVVTDNMTRYASGQPLHNQQPGKDEISVLDNKFHELSDSLSEARSKDQAVFANMPVGLITCLDSGIIEDLNPQAEKLLGIAPDQEHQLEEFMPHKGDIDILKNEDTTIKRTRLRRLDGSQFPAEMSIARFMHNGKARSLLALLDVSDRENIENLRQEFVAIVSHDICSPLTSISACLTLLAEGAFGSLSDRGQHQIGVARNESKRLIRLTRDLLDMARIESGNVQLDKASHRVDELVERAIEAVKFSAEEKTISLVHASSDLSLVCDSDRIIQILVNFLTNAIKYSPAGTTITVQSKVVDNCVQISVSDQGVGIPADYREQIFERFKQVRKDDKQRGTGLGLAVCRMLAEAHGGTVGVTSQEGQGSTFWVSLPAC